jgi:hypothetical protein
MYSKNVNHKIIQKKKRDETSLILKKIIDNNYLARLGLYSDDTDNFFRPFALLRANTLRPVLLDMRSLNPCLLLRLRTDG